MSETLNGLLDSLDDLKRSFGPAQGVRVLKLLSQLGRRRFDDAESLARLHEALLFFRAYPHDAAVVRRTEQILATFQRRVRQLAESGADITFLSEPEVSGIAGTSFSALWSYDIVRHLVREHSAQVDLDWEGYEAEPLLVPTLKKFLPLFEDAAYAEYPVDYLRWIRAIKGRGESALEWLMQRFLELSVPDIEKGEVFDALKLWVRWDFGNSRVTRTRMRGTAGEIFYHEGPLLGRRHVSIESELASAKRLKLEKLSLTEGEKLLRAGRDTMAIRYRELHGFTFGDPRSVMRVRAGRGVDFYIWGIPPERRLPLLAYHSALIYKNRVPVGYAESLGLFERSEVGVNLFYTFRDGESAWIYARLLALLHRYLGITVFSIDPYQIGHHNEEGIESGAFWFYRKLGFRPTRPDLAKIVTREERRMAREPDHRTSPANLRKIAAGHVLYEAATAPQTGAWDRFHIGNIGLAIERHISERFAGDVGKFRSDSFVRVARAIGMNTANLGAQETRAFSQTALPLSLIPGLSRWSSAEKEAIMTIVKAKARANESRYLRLLQGQAKLRDEMLRLGSGSSSHANYS